MIAQFAVAPTPVDPLTVMLQLMQTMHEDRKKDKEREDFLLRQLQWQQDKAKFRTRIDAVARFPVITDKHDPEEYFSSLENCLRMAGMDEDDCKLSLYTHLNDTYICMLMDMETNPNYTFEDVRDRILDSSGLTPVMAGQQFFAMNGREFRGMHTAGVWGKLTRLVRQATKRANKVVDAVALLSFAKIRSVQSTAGMRFLDNRMIETEEDAKTALQAWEASGGLLYYEEYYHEKQKWRELHRNTAFSCPRCGEEGQKAAVCPNSCSKGPQKEQQQTKRDSKKDVTQSIICYGCGQQGHKANNCPNKQQTKLEKANKVMKIFFTLSTPEELQNSAFVVAATVDGAVTTLVLDSGAAISVIREELVADDKKRLRMVTLRDANGGTVQRDKVNVEIKVVGFTFSQVVALSPGETVDNKGLLSITMDMEIAARIFKDYFVSARQSKALAVSTRAQTREEAEAQEAEALQLQEDKPYPKPVRIGNGVKVESGKQSQYSQQDECVDNREGERVEVERKEEAMDVEQEKEARLKEVENEAVALELDQIAKNTDRDKFKQELMSDESVKSLRELGDRKEQGYTWKRGILVKIASCG